MMRTRHICGMLLTMLLLAPVGAATDGRQGGGVECETTITIESFQASSISIPNGRCVEIDLGTLEEEPCWNSTSMRAEAMPSTSFFRCERSAGLSLRPGLPLLLVRAGVRVEPQ